MGSNASKRPTLRRGWGGRLLPLLLALGVAAHAPCAAADESQAAGLQKFDEGRKAFDAGQYDHAIEAFEASYELLASPNTRLYIGRCYRSLGRVASAYTALRLAAREAQDRLTASGEKRYGATRDAATREAAELEPRVPRLTIAVPAGTPDGFVVKRNGEDLPKAAWGVAVETDPGVVVVEASGPRLVTFKTTVTLAEGANSRVDVEAKRVPTATLNVTLGARPAGLAATLDGRPVDVAQLEAPREVDVGEHELVVSAPGYVSFTWTKSVEDGERVVIDAVLTPEVRALSGHGPPKWIFFALSGGAVATLGVASGLALHAQSEQSRQLALDPYARDASTRDSIRSQGTLANVLYVGGGVLAIGAVVAGFTTHWRSEDAAEPSVAVAPWMTVNGAGVGAHGHF